MEDYKKKKKRDFKEIDKNLNSQQNTKYFSLTGINNCSNNYYNSSLFHYKPIVDDYRKNIWIKD
jgi:hypothetical protein